MFGALLKEEARTEEKKAAQEGTKNRKTVVISIMPCTAKKAEIKRPEHFTEGKQDVDYVLTTTEVTRMIQEAGIDLSRIEPEALDMPFGLSSGAGAIFGVTGGVTEAVLRRLKNNSSSEVLDAISFTGIRGVDGIKEASVDLNGREVKIAVVNLSLIHILFLPFFSNSGIPSSFSSCAIAWLRLGCEMQSCSSAFVLF